MNSLEKAIDFLKKENATLVAINKDEIYISYARGVAPIIEKIDENPSFFCGASVADKVIGKAAAMLLSKYKIKELHTSLISEIALEYFEKTPISVTYDNLVPNIINRDKTDICPMEKCVLSTNDENEAEKLIRATRKKLLKK